MVISYPFFINQTVLNNVLVDDGGKNCDDNEDNDISAAKAAAHYGDSDGGADVIIF